MKLELSFDKGVSWLDWTDFYKSESAVIDNQALSEDLCMAQDLFNCRVLIDAGSEQESLLNDAQDWIYIKYYNDFGVLEFSGCFRSEYSFETDFQNNDGIAIQATDYSELLRVEFDDSDDLVCRNFKVLDPVDVAHSLVHFLFGKAGVPTTLIGTMSIGTVIPTWTPADKNVLASLDVLLHETGYALNFDVGVFAPVQWRFTGTPPAIAVFDDSTCLRTMKVDRKKREWDGILLTWHTLADKNAVIFQFDLPFGDDGLRNGYPIEPGYKYPPEANTADSFQEYTDDGLVNIVKSVLSPIGQKTEAIKNWGIVATRNHQVKDKFDPGIVRLKSEYSNTRAQIVYENTGGTEARLYYSKIQADVTYRSAENKATGKVIANPKKMQKYTATHIHTAQLAAEYVGARARILAGEHLRYEIISDLYISTGVIVDVDTGSSIQRSMVLRRIHEDAGQPLDADHWYRYEVMGIGEYEITGTNDSANTPSGRASDGESAPVTYLDIPLGLYLSTTSLVAKFDAAGNLLPEQSISMKVLRGAYDYTQAWAIDHSPSAGISGDLVQGIYTITTALESGYVDFTATFGDTQISSRLTILVDNKVSYSDLLDGFDVSGGTTAPTIPVLGTHASLRNIYITWDKQINATGNVFHELQVTSDISGAPNPAGWTGIYYGPATEFLDSAKGLGGTTASPVATTYWYRCRRVVGSNVSTWSTSMSAVARAANAGDIEAGSILAEKIDAAVLNALIANINQSLTVSAATGWTAGYQAVYTSNPLNKYRAYLDDDEIAVEKCTASASNGSGGWTATTWVKYGRLTSTDLMLGGAGILSVLEGTSDVDAGGAWNFANSPTYNGLPLFHSGNGGSGSGNNADKVRSVTPGALGLALLALAGTLGTGWSTALAAACNAGGRSLLGLSALGTNWSTALAAALGTGWTTMLAAQPLSKFAPAAGGLWTGSVISANTTVPSMAVGETRVYKCETNDISITLTLPASGTYYVKRWYYGLYTFPLGGGTYTNNNVIGALDSGGNYGGGGAFTMTSGAGRMIEILRIA